MDNQTTENPEIVSEITLEAVKRKAVKGVMALTGRTVFLVLLGLVATFLLTVFLSPSQWGVFVLVSAFVSFLGYFSDIGLAGALIQKKDRPTRQALETTFTIQNTLAVLLAIVVFLATPYYQQWARLDREAVFLLWALAVSLVLSSLTSIPSVLLERKLEFSKLVIPQIVSQTLYQLVAVLLAWQGFGITSFTVAVLVRGVSSLVMIYILQPWKPGICFDRSSLKDLLHFGVPYQVNTFLAVAKDDGMTMFLGGILGPANMGLLGWAQKWTTQPLRLVMDPVTRVTFPAFSRMQEHRDELARAITKSVFFICALVFPALVILVIVSPLLINLIPRYTKWEPALLALGLLSINYAWAAVTTPLTNFLNATGKIKTTFRLMVMWTALSWIFIPGLASFLGVNGAAAGYALVGFSSVVAILVARRSVRINLFEGAGKPLLAAIFMGIVLMVGRRLLPESWTGLILMVSVAVLSYLAAIFILYGSALMVDVKKVLFGVKGEV